MKNVILICGLNGAGKSTFGKALAEELNFRFIDIEDIFFSKQDNPDYPYENSRSYEEAVALLNEFTDKDEGFVLASVTGNFGDEFISRIKCAICIEVPRDIRLKRIYDRSYRRFGNKYQEQTDSFHLFCESRDENHVKNWLANLSCPIIMTDGTLPIYDNIKMITEHPAI